MSERNDAWWNTITLLNTAAVITVLFQAGHLFYFINRYSVDVPFWDQWDFYDAFFHPHGMWDIFSWQHGPHRQGIGFLLIWTVNELTGWNQRAQCFAIGGVMLIAATTFLWLKKRLFGSIEWHDAIPVLIILSMNQWEVYANTPNVSHGALPLLLTLLLCVSWTFSNHIFRYASVVVINLLAIFTGFGIFAGFVTPIIIAIDCRHAFRSRKYSRLLVAVCALCLALASMGLFFYKYQFAMAASRITIPDPKWYLYPVFVAREFTSLILPNQLARGVGMAVGWVSIVSIFAILVSTAVALFTSGEHYRRSQVVFLLLGFSVLFSANAAIGRLCLGLDAASSSRYVPLLMPAGIGAYLFLLNFPRWKESRNLLPILFAVTIICTVPLWNCKLAGKFRAHKSEWVHAYMLTGNSAKADSMSGGKIYPNPAATDLDRKLEWLRVHHYSFFR